MGPDVYEVSPCVVHNWYSGSRWRIHSKPMTDCGSIIAKFHLPMHVCIHFNYTMSSENKKLVSKNHLYKNAILSRP